MQRRIDDTGRKQETLEEFDDRTAWRDDRVLIFSSVKDLRDHDTLPVEIITIYEARLRVNKLKSYSRRSNDEDGDDKNGKNNAPKQ